MNGALAGADRAGGPSPESSGSRRRLVASVALAGAAFVGVMALGLILGANPFSGSASPTASTEVASNWWLSPAGIIRAVEFREQARLPASTAWVQVVARDPRALANLPKYGVPLTANEISLLDARANSIAAIRSVIDKFAAEHPEAWAGDFTQNGQLVAMVVDPSGDLINSLNSQVAPNAPLLVKPARWTLRALDALKKRVLSDFWLSAHYHVVDLGVSVGRNLVELQVSSADLSVPGKIGAHFDVGEQLAVTIDGTGVASLPRGSIAGRVVDGNGRGVPGLAVELVAAVPGLNATGDVGIATGDDGSFLIRDVPATSYTVRILSQLDARGSELPHLNWILMGSGDVEVKEGQTANVEVVVRRP
jgi:Carboxypeptidase regulatory-like domain